MTPTQIIAQIVGILGVAVFVFLYHNKNMKNILRVKLLMDVLWATHYLLLGAYSGFGTNVVCCGRELIFMNNDKPLFKKKFWLWLFVAFCWVSAALTWGGWYCIIPPRYPPWRPSPSGRKTSRSPAGSGLSTTC